MDALVRARRAELASGNGDDFEFVDNLTNHILGLQTHEELRTAYHRLAPGEVFAAADAAVLSSLRFAQRLEGCDYSAKIRSHCQKKARAPG